MRQALRRSRDRVVVALRGGPATVLSAYRAALAQAGVDPLVLEAFGDRRLAQLAPHQHRALTASARSSRFVPAPRPQVVRAKGARPPLLLHLGAFKTGTTTTQRVLHSDRDRLWSHGILYPPSVPFFGTRSFPCHNGMLAPLTRPAWSRDPALVAFRRYLTALGKGAERVVLSAERFYGALDGEDVLIAPHEWDESYWPRRRKLLQKLADYLGDFEVTPVVWLRDPAALADSLYREMVKANLPRANPAHRRYAGSFAEFRDAAAPLWNFDRQIAMIEEVFGDVAVHRFEDGDVVGTMYSHLGVEPPAAVAVGRVNESADARVVLWLAGTDAGATRQRQAFGWSPEAASAIREGSSGSMWESEAARSAFLAGLPNTRFGAEYFPPQAPLKDRARLTTGDAKRLSKAFEAWLPLHPESEFQDVPESEKRDRKRNDKRGR